MTTSFDAAALATFNKLYPETSGTLRHELVDHPLLQLDRLAEFAARIDPKNVEYNIGQLPVGIDPAAVPGNGLSIEETIRSIEENGSWMVLKWIENDPDYRALLHEALAPLQPYVAPKTGEMLTLQGFIFVSSPGAVTPYHMDPEHNILLQIRGDKVMTVRSVIPDEQTLGEVAISFTARLYPTSAESTYGPFSAKAPTDARFSGRSVKMKVTGDVLDDWRVGVMRLETTTAGKR